MNVYEEWAQCKFAAVVAVIVQLSPLILTIAGGVYIVSVVLDTIIKLVDRIKELAEDLKEFVKTICSEAKTLYEAGWWAER